MVKSFEEIRPQVLILRIQVVIPQSLVTSFIFIMHLEGFQLEGDFDL